MIQSTPTRNALTDTMACAPFSWATHFSQIALLFMKLTFLLPLLATFAFSILSRLIVSGLEP